MNNNIQDDVKQILISFFGKESFIDFGSPRLDDKHFNLHIISDKFEGKSKIDRSRMVYDLLGDMIKTNYIHALRMSLKTYNEIQD